MKWLAKEGLLDHQTKLTYQFLSNVCQEKVIESLLVRHLKLLPFSKTLKATRLLYLIHSDICGLLNVKASHGALIFLLFLMSAVMVMNIY